MTSTEFMLEVLQHASDARRKLCAVRKRVVLAKARMSMCDEEIACYQQLIAWEREAIKLRTSLENGDAHS